MPPALICFTIRIKERDKILIFVGVSGFPCVLEYCNVFGEYDNERENGVRV